MPQFLGSTLLIGGLALVGCHGAQVVDAEDLGDADAARDEAAVDARVDGDAPASDARVDDAMSGCGVTVLFCSGFESSPTVEWDTVNEAGGGTVERDVLRRSGAFSLEAKIPASSASGVRALVHKSFSFAPSTRPVAVTAWVRLEVPTIDASMQLVRLASDNEGHGVTIVYGPTGLTVQTSGATAHSALITTSPPNKTFFKLVLEAPLVADRARVRVFFGDALVFDDSSGPTAVAGTVTPALHLGAATLSGGPTKADVVVRYDDVSIEPR